MFKLFALILLAVAGANASFWSSCGVAGVVGPDQIVSTHCPGDRCQVVRGSFFYANAYFTPVKAHQVLNTRGTIFLAPIGPGVPVPMPPPFDNACNDLYIGNTFVGCPTSPNVQVIWRITAEIPSIAPTGNSRVRFELLENNVLEACADVLITIV